MTQLQKSNRSPGSLSDRKKKILKSVIEAHIAGGEPVGSKYLMEKMAIHCSSATIRNEMAELEKMGYLEQPHTSAGRIPSEQGYRFYVESLVERYTITNHEVTEINSLLKEKTAELDRILDEASRLASAITNYTGVTIKPKVSTVSVVKYQSIYLSPRSFILIMVTPSADVKTKNITAETDVTPEVVAALAETLNRHAVGLRAEQITLQVILRMEDEMGDAGGLVHPTIKAIYELLNTLDDGEVKYNGVKRLLEYPEYSDMDELKGVLGTLEQKDTLVSLMSKEDPIDNPNGNLPNSDCSVKVLNHSALVYMPVMRNGNKVGAIGLIGPLRMDYAKVLTVLENVCRNVGSLLTEPSPTLPDSSPANRLSAPPGLPDAGKDEK